MRSIIPLHEAREFFEVIESSVFEYSDPLAPSGRWAIVERLRTNHCRMLLGQWNEAIDDLRALVEETHLPAAYLLLAETMVQARQVDSALSVLLDLDTCHPDLEEKELLRGIVLHIIDRTTEAKHVLHQVIRRKPGLILAWKALIDIHVDEGDQLGAVRVFNEALMHIGYHPKVLSLQSSLHCES